MYIYIFIHIYVDIYIYTISSPGGALQTDPPRLITWAKNQQNQ